MWGSVACTQGRVDCMRGRADTAESMDGTEESMCCNVEGWDSMALVAQEP